MRRLRHRRTDPACSEFRPVRGLFARWRERRARGKGCLVCITRRVARYARW